MQSDINMRTSHADPQRHAHKQTNEAGMQLLQINEQTVLVWSSKFQPRKTDGGSICLTQNVR